MRGVLENKRLREENRLLRRQVERTYCCGDLLGKSAVMQKVCERIQRTAETDFDVLIVGETGTGKELAAHAIHHRSKRKDKPFAPVNCGAIPEELLESEFFGHERGAFTGAQNRSLGLLEFANHGTFFLDELNQLPLRLQGKLLRVVQERKIRRVGATKEIDIDVRIIAASSMSLEDAVKGGQFRAGPVSPAECGADRAAAVAGANGGHSHAGRRRFWSATGASWRKRQRRSAPRCSRC